MNSWLLWLADGLVLLGLFIMTVAIFGLFRMPDIYTQLHAASKAVVLGVIPILLSVVILGDTAIRVRVFLIACFILLTTPVSAHAIGRAAYLKRISMKEPDTLDESGQLAREPGGEGETGRTK